jgi:hypothetical protein
MGGNEEEAGGAAGVGGNDEGEATGGAGGAPEEPAEPHPYRALQIATGQQHSCALLEDHRVKCWGENFYGQLGLGDETTRGLDPNGMGDALPFVELGTGRTAKSIAAARYGSCALLDDASVKCWGMSWLTGEPIVDYAGDEPSEMGDALPTVPLGERRSAVDLAIGYSNACVALDDGQFACGEGGGEVVSAPSPSSTPLLRLFGGGNLVFGLFEDGTAYQMPSGRWVAEGVVLAAESERGLCFVKTEGALLCKGILAPPFPQQLPNATALGLSWEQNLCAIVEEGRVDCFGRNLDRMQWAERHDASWITVPLDSPAAQLSTGATGFQCALLATGRVTCWDWAEYQAPAAGENHLDASALVPVDFGTWYPPGFGAGGSPDQASD